MPSRRMVEGISASAGDIGFESMAREDVDTLNKKKTPPRLCYIGPAIGPALGGQALLYKLLSGYPSEKLMLVQTHTDQLHGRRLDAAEVINLPAPPRWAGPRVRTLFDMSFSLGAKLWVRRLTRQ